MNEGRAGSAFLDVNFYKSKYGDLQQAYGNNNKAYYEHFVKYGMAEGRQASQSFDVKYYLSQYGDLQKAYGNNYTEAIKHYIYYGKNEGRKGAATANNGGNGNNTPNTPPTNTEYTPTPDKYGNKIISQKELAKCITKVAITTENWKDYFELKDREDISKNAFGEILSISKYTTLNLKDNTYYSTSLEFEITNENLIYDHYWNDNNGEYRKVTISVNNGYKNEWNNYSIYNGVFLDKDPDINVYDYRFTINDIKCNRTIGNVYIFNIPDNFWTVNNNGKKYLFIENPQNEYGGSYTAYYPLDSDSNYWLQRLGDDIENGKLKDISL